MLGLIFRLRLLVLFGTFCWRLFLELFILPYRSFWGAVVLFAWIGISTLTMMNSSEPTQPVVPVNKPITALLLQNYHQAGFSPSTLSPFELRQKQRLWEEQQTHTFKSRDFLLNGMFIYLALEDVERAQSLFEMAKQTDPNNPLFRSPIFEILQ